jgi:signal transduction histidine kinase
MARWAAHQAQGSAFRLRALTDGTRIALAAMALLACSALVIFTIVSSMRVDRVQAATRSMRSADAISAGLLRYARESDLAYLTPRRLRDTARGRAEADLFAEVASARSSAQSPAERHLAQEAESKIIAYLAAREAGERKGRPLEEVLVGATPSLDAALATSDGLARQTHETLEHLHSSWRRWASVGMIVGLTVAWLVITGFSVVLVLMRKDVFAPLAAIVDSVDRYAAGDRAVRIVPSGPAEFRRTAETLNEIADRLAREEHDRLTFLSGVAHDLRNPLAALQMAVRYLEPDHPLPSEENIRHTLVIVGREVQVLNRMVGDFLDATRIEGGHLELRTACYDVRDLARTSAELYQTISFRHRIRLSLPSASVNARCDGERIEQVLNNLVSNAIKYSPAGGDVDISVSEQAGEAIIAVSDHGIGIAPTELERIFEPFRRTGASREIAPGVGLGLSVARRIVAQHGGRLEVQSQVGVGSTFRVHLPRSATIESP